MRSSAGPARPRAFSRLTGAASAAGRLLLPEALGAAPTGDRLARIRSSPQFHDGAFRNPIPTGLLAPGSVRALLRSALSGSGRASRRPSAAVPIHPSTATDLAVPPVSGLRMTWMGHASVLAEIDGRRVLFDPVWQERCSPFSFAGPRRLHPVPVSADRLGELDAVIISHDHYDHLDMPTIRDLAGTGTVFAVPLGVGAHLERWGVPARQITELDWHESATVSGLTLTATPARHFCGRGVRNRSLTLWASWVVAGPDHRVFDSGDTGYFPGFARIGAEHGPFDATMMQIGAYSEFWPDVHMTPEQALRAHSDVSGGTPHGVMLPIHWGTFNLAPHPWGEPPEATLTCAGKTGATVAFPIPGQPFEPGSGTVPKDSWWRQAAPPERRPTPAKTDHRRRDPSDTARVV